ncbi:hypothetical protein WA1_06660 [Scytonema hofmannii PCC 7110]|uniref:Uncharacterized protein n=1 Tax=Scytonema hofmannii PCC 7110 TaxID=128403 RepID=A0A139WSU1_9CYAN|nr:hypothetical protein [Scytonema hofmannii]KYC35502.1 hypothetical protein WA1_06660 [Scytonema hofmannii PCC 7110]
MNFKVLLCSSVITINALAILPVYAQQLTPQQAQIARERLRCIMLGQGGDLSEPLSGELQYLQLRRLNPQLADRCRNLLKGIFPGQYLPNRTRRPVVNPFPPGSLIKEQNVPLINSTPATR